MKYSYKDNDALLDLIHEVLKNRKEAEGVAAQGEGSYEVIHSNRIRLDALEYIYIELLKEAKNKELRLTKEQLLKRIVYTSSR